MKIYFGRIILGLLLSCGIIGGVSAQDREIVDIEMVLAVDISSSVDPDERSSGRFSTPRGNRCN